MEQNERNMKKRPWDALSVCAIFIFYIHRSQFLFSALDWCKCISGFEVHLCVYLRRWKRQNKMKTKTLNWWNSIFTGKICVQSSLIYSRQGRKNTLWIRMVSAWSSSHWQRMHFHLCCLHCLAHCTILFVLFCWRNLCNSSIVQAIDINSNRFPFPIRAISYLNMFLNWHWFVEFSMNNRCI